MMELKYIVIILVALGFVGYYLITTRPHLITFLFLGLIYLGVILFAFYKAMQE